ncbi:hypothetical protein Tco_0987631 [Tanacetum coccineum]
MSVKDSITTQTCKVSKEEFKDFLTLYPIPSEYHVILPKSNQTVFDAPPRFIYRGSNLLVVPSSPLLLSCAKLMVVSPLSTSSEGSSTCVELRLGRYPTSVRVFPGPILFLAGLKPSWEYGQQRPAIMAGSKDDEDLSFLPKEPSPGFDTGSPSVSVNTEPLKANKEPVILPVEVTSDFGKSPKPELFVVHPGSVAARIMDRKCKTRGGSSRPHVKRKLAPGSSISHATSAKTSSSKDDAPFMTVSDDDEAVVDNVINRRSRELLQVIEKLGGEFDVMRSKMILESQKWAGYQQSLSTLESKVTSLKAEKARLEAVEVSLRKEVEELKQDRREVACILAILYGRCRAYEQVADMKEPFDLSKVKGYRSSYKKDHTQASNDFSTTTFLWLDEFVADPSAPIKVLLSKKPPSLQRHVPSRT